MAGSKRSRGALEGDEVHQRGDEEGDSECKSAKAIRLLREVTTLLSETTDQPSKHVATGPVRLGHQVVLFIVLSLTPSRDAISSDLNPRSNKNMSSSLKIIKRGLPLSPVAVNSA